MSDKPISPLRRRMIEDMTVRNFVEKTHNDYIRHVRTFTTFLGRARCCQLTDYWPALSFRLALKCLQKLIHFRPTGRVCAKPWEASRAETLSAIRFQARQRCASMPTPE